MMRMYLKMAILTSKYRSQRWFAQACKKSDNWLSTIIVGRMDPTEEDKQLILSTLANESNEWKKEFSERVYLELECVYRRTGR